METTRNVTEYIHDADKRISNDISTPNKFATAEISNVESRIVGVVFNTIFL